MRGVTFNSAKVRTLFKKIIGPNGCGKSTLLKSLPGLIKPVKGSIDIFGMPPSIARRRIGYVPQRETLDISYPATVLDVVIMGRYAGIGMFRRPGRPDRNSLFSNRGICSG